MSIGPVAVTSILVMTGVSALATPFTAPYIALVITAGLLIGMLQVLLSFMKMSFLVNLISQPVISGFIAAAAIITIISQFAAALGMTIPDFEYPYQTLWYAIAHISEAHVLTVVLCLLSIVVMQGLKYWKKSFPGALFVLIIAATTTVLLHLDVQGVAIIGALPRGLPSFQWPPLNFQTLEQLLPTVDIGIIVSGTAILRKL